MRLFNKTFFKFVFGFIVIILVSFLGILATEYYDSNQSVLPDDNSIIENESQ